MWTEGRQVSEVVDWNKKFAELKGELPEDIARKTLGKFLMHNIGFTVRILTGFILEPYQRIMIKGWLNKNFSMSICGRGFGKSLLCSHFAYLYCLFNPGKQLIMISATFRSSRKILENIDNWSKKKTGILLRQTIDGDMVKKPDMYKINFKNGSSIIALPLGDAEKLRGFRCNALCIDEGLLISQNTIDTVLKPFLIAPPPDEVTRRQKIREREKRLIDSGAMTENERQVFTSEAKMIILSSASYKWEDLYELYKKYLNIINNQDDAEESDGSVGSYLVQQLSYEAANPDLIENSIKEEISSGMYSESVINREYKAQFIQDSDGYFRAAKMEECTIKAGDEPCIEIVGDQESEYILAIDPNMSAAETSDHFAMCVIKLVDKKLDNGEIKKIGMVVHNYAVAGVELKHHINYLYYILTHFNIVYIACDSTQGENMGFINVCNESEIFKEKRLKLNSINADFGKEDFGVIAEQIQKSYNLQNNVIVQQQSFHSAFQRAANEYMQACFDRKNIMFAAKALANGPVMSALREQDVGTILKSHPEFTDIIGQWGSKDEFISNQDVLMDMVKKECALIEPRMSQLGNVSYDIPQHLKRSHKSKNRVRKDSYSALLLGVWATKLYLESQSRPKQELPTTFEPFLI